MTTPKIKFSGGDYRQEHFRFVRKSDCQPWHFPPERQPLAPQGDTLFDRFLAVAGLGFFMQSLNLLP